MNNNHMIFLAGLQEAMREFVAIDKSKLLKEIKAELKAIEKANSGAKKLAEADKVLADAHKRDSEKLAETYKVCDARLAQADAKIADSNKLLQVREQSVLAAQARADAAMKAAQDKARDMEDLSVAVAAREVAVAEKEEQSKTKLTGLENAQRRLAENEARIAAKAQRMKQAAEED